MTAGRLLSLREVADVLALRDTRAARRRLDALRVPRLDVGGGRVLVDPDDLRRAIRAAMTVPAPEGPAAVDRAAYEARVAALRRGR